MPIIDGVDLWSSLSNDLESPRNSMLHNIDESRNIAALRVGDWKMVIGMLLPGLYMIGYGTEKFILKFPPFCQLNEEYQERENSK